MCGSITFVVVVVVFVVVVVVDTIKLASYFIEMV